MPRRLLNSHSGYDLGARAVAESLARSLEAPLFLGTVSRLVVDLNRSLHHRRWSTLDLSAAEREWLLGHYYRPYRESIRAAMGRMRSRGILHLAIHSFTPVLGGQRRTADIGILYDPSRRRESATARLLQGSLRETESFRVRRNYPYRGVSDGLTTALRAQFPPSAYSGLEIEINQQRLRSEGARRVCCDALVAALRAAT